MHISTTHLERSLQTLNASLVELNKAPAESIAFEIYRNAVIKGFELTLEVCGKLLRKALKTYDANPKNIDGLSYKEVFKQYTKTIIEIHSKGKSYLERAFYLIHLTDFISVDLAELNKLDPTEVKVIDYLKEKHNCCYFVRKINEPRLKGKDFRDDEDYTSILNLN